MYGNAWAIEGAYLQKLVGTISWDFCCQVRFGFSSSLCWVAFQRGCPLAGFMGKQSLHRSPGSTCSRKSSSYAWRLTHNKGMSKEAYCKAEEFPVRGRTSFHCLEFEWAEGCFGNCLAVSQPDICMLGDGLVLGPDCQAQPHMQPLGGWVPLVPELCRR